MAVSMEFANDLMAGLRGNVRAAPVGAAIPGFDWFGLHARLAAAHAARRELRHRESARPIGNGGFASWQGLAAATGKSLPGVNPTDSADGKAQAAMNSFIAGEPGAGGRGQQ